MILEPQFLLRAYAEGIFPMAEEDGRISWYSPDPRGVIPLDNRFHIPHGLKRVWRKRDFRITSNVAFAEVMKGCAGREETWIDETIFETYCALHEIGWAHSVEVWYEGELVGGLYGVALGAAFFGESMFHRKTDASKVALVALVEQLRQQGFILLDTQWNTSHLAQFGAMSIARKEYLQVLQEAVLQSCVFGKIRILSKKEEMEGRKKWQE